MANSKIFWTYNLEEGFENIQMSKNGTKCSEITEDAEIVSFGDNGNIECNELIEI